MKKILVLILSLALLGTFALPGLAADDTSRMMHGDDYQDALLVGKITEVVEGQVVFDVVRTVNGSPAKSPFLLFEGELFSSPQLSGFTAGDGILASVRYLHGNRANGTLAYRAFKVELKPDKKIKMDPGWYDVGFLEWYVNAGEDNLYGDGDSVYRRDEGSEEGQLLFDGSQWHLDSLDPKYKAPQVTREPIKPLLSAFKSVPLRVVLEAFAAIGLAGFAIGLGMGFLIGRRKRLTK